MKTSGKLASCRPAVADGSGVGNAGARKGANQIHKATSKPDIASAPVAIPSRWVGE